MEPFAQSSRSPFSRRVLVVLGLACASFTVWHFELLPVTQPVPTGTLADAPDGIEPDEFMDLLSQAPAKPEPSGEELTLDGFESPDADANTELSEEEQLLMALSSQSEPDVDNRSALDGESQFVTEPSLAEEFAPRDTGIRRASFEQARQVAEPQVLEPEVAAALRQIDDYIAQDNILDAHAELSRLYWKKPDIRPLFMGRLTKTSALIYANSKRHFLEPYLVEPGDSLESIGRQYNVPWTYLALLNRIKPEELQAGQKLKVLTGPFGAVVDLEERTLTIHSHGWFVRQYRVGVGADATTGSFTVQTMKPNPVWKSPSGNLYESGEPANPLGSFWIGLDAEVGIHGSTDPSVIGSIAAKGCIHLRDADINEVTHLLTHGSPVRIRQ